VNRSRDAGAWFRQPVVWLGAAILLASIVGCITTIVLAWRHADAPVNIDSGRAMGQLRHSVAAPPPAQENR
jgi:hypothetical protein